MLQIAIGRVLYETGEDMTESMWLDFQSSVEELICLDHAGSFADTKALGYSHYESVREETCIFVWFFAEPLTFETDRKLSILAKAFGQDAVAVTVGNTKFVKGVESGLVN